MFFSKYFISSWSAILSPIRLLVASPKVMAPSPLVAIFMKSQASSGCFDPADMTKACEFGVDQSPGRLMAPTVSELTQSALLLNHR
jgi:hypothetical protein